VTGHGWQRGPGWNGWALDESGNIVPHGPRQPDERVIFWQVICSHRSPGDDKFMFGEVADRRNTAVGGVAGYVLPPGKTNRARTELRAFIATDTQHPMNGLSLRCPRCGKDTRLTQANLVLALDALADTPGRILDVAYLP